MGQNNLMNKNRVLLYFLTTKKCDIFENKGKNLDT